MVETPPGPFDLELFGRELAGAVAAARSSAAV
jgi:hypothetical protein